MGVRGLIGAWAIAELCFMTNGGGGSGGDLSAEGWLPSTPTNCRSCRNILLESWLKEKVDTKLVKESPAEKCCFQKKRRKIGIMMPQNVVPLKILFQLGFV